MKLLTLTIENIAPFRRKQTIHFDQLPNLFLVYGPTGAGKSTIFDCVCLALYNKTAGEVEKGNPVYPVGKSTGEITLTFEVRDRTYRIERTYERDKGSKVCFYLPDGEVLTKQNPTTEKVEELLGLTHSQFVRSSIIAQGEFQKVIRASTKERQELLQSIFNTYRYEELVTVLRQEHVAAQEALDREALKIETVLNGMTLEELEAELQSLGNSVIAWQDNLKKVEERQQHCDNRVTATRKKLENFKKVIKVQEDIKNLKSNLELAKAAVTQHEENLRKQKELYESTKTAGKNKHQQDLLDAELLNVQKALEGAEAHWISLNQRREELITKINTIDEHEKARLEKIAVCKEEFDVNAELLKKLQEEIVSLFTEIESYQEGFKAVSYRNDMLELFRTNQETLEASTESLETFTKDKLEALALRKQELQKRLQEQEGALVKAQASRKVVLITELSKLSDNSKDLCPICGTPWKFEHSESSNDSDYVRVQSVIATLKNDIQYIVAEIKKTETEYEIGVTKLQPLKDEVKQLENWLKEHPETLIDGKPPFTQAGLDSMQKAYEDLLERKKELEVSNEVLESEIRKLESSSQLEVKYEYSRFLGDVNDQLNEQDRVLIDYKNKILELEKEKEKHPYDAEIWEQHQDAQNRLIELQRITPQREVDKLEVQLSEIQSKLIDLPLIDPLATEDSINQEISDLAKELDQWNYKITEHQAMIQELKSKIAVIQSKLDQCSKLKESYEDARLELDRASVYEPLWKAKVGIGAYAVVYYLEAILSVTNTLLQLVRPRYSLIRDQEEGGRGKKGLDLLVYDSMTQKTRSVDTLSGGETFIASLSLAIGSAIIYSRFNNRVPDLLLLDEGFGTLDRQTLDDVIAMLTEISKTCKIGIISHVTSLQTQLGTSLEVGTSVSEGSYIHQPKKKKGE